MTTIVLLGPDYYYKNCKTVNISCHSASFVLLYAVSYIACKCHVIKHIENFSGYSSFTSLASSWGRVVGPEVGPKRKWWGLGPTLSIAGAATVNLLIKSNRYFQWLLSYFHGHLTLVFCRHGFLMSLFTGSAICMVRKCKSEMCDIHQEQVGFWIIYVFCS